MNSINENEAENPEVKKISWFKMMEQTNYYNRNNIDLCTSYTPMILMDGSFEMVPVKIKGLATNLLKFQRVSVKAMIDIENTKKINFLDKDREYILKTSAGIFSDPLGSGKTISMLAIILLNKMPKMVSDIVSLNAISKSYNTKDIIRGCIRRKYKKIIKTTIIFAGVSVIEQWAGAIEQFTKIKYYKVTNVHNLRKLLKYMEDGSINNYDLVLIKNGRVTSNIVIPFGISKEKKNNLTSAHMYNIISNMRNICWKRVIIDDFDSIGLPYNAGIVNGVFTWYISSTCRVFKPQQYLTSEYNKIEDSILHFDYGCSKILTNKSLFNVFNVQNNIEFIKRYNNLCNPRFYVAIYNNPADRYVGLLDEIGAVETNEIVQMINSGSIITATKVLGIEHSSVADIFEKILGTQYESYKHSTEILEFIDTIPEDPSLRRPFSENPNSADTYNKGDLLKWKFPEYNYPNLKQIIQKYTKEYTDIKNTTGSAIKRIQDNIGDNFCPICTDPIKDCNPAIILKCCSMVTCDICAFVSLESRGGLMGRCPKCRSLIDMKSLIAVSCDLDSLVDFKFLKKKALSSNSSESSDNDESGDNDESSDNDESGDEEEKERTKIDGIFDIIDGRIPREAEEKKMEIHHLQSGTMDYIESPNSYKKVLIFTSYNESLHNICESLEGKNIKFWKLAGNAKNINKIARDFNHCRTTCVLVINSTKHCSGLNLQTATDLIFYHVIRDRNIESQVSGRAQRLGRDCTLNIYYIIYNNEANFINR